VLGEIRQKIILARFSTYFAMLYKAGISVLDCIQICEKIVGNRVMEEGLQRVGRSISEGQGISQAFLATKLFPPLVLRMLRVGESTGALDTALLNVSYFYNRQVREGIARMQTLLGPAHHGGPGHAHRGHPLLHLPADLRRDRQDQVLAPCATSSTSRTRAW
jgi:type IV pilus assembly protein PilC